jgi:LacI family transcriptional regulator
VLVVTSRDVARLAGVSQPTVSRALRDQPGMSAATRARVREAARSLGYVPSQTGRSLATRRTRRIGVVVAELSNPFYPALVVPLHDALERAEYRMILVTDRGTDGMDLEALLDGSLDGVVLSTCELASPLPSELARRGIPFVFVNREPDVESSDACVPDNAAGAAAVADLFVSLSHRRIAAVFGPRRTSTGRDREFAFRDSLAARGMALPTDYTHTGAFAHSSGVEAIRRFAALDVPPTAVFCANDVIAIGALNAATACGLRVPTDLSIVGFDDIAVASWERINLTTVRVDLTEMAEATADRIAARILAPDAPPRRRLFPTSLVLRGSHTSAAS